MCITERQMKLITSSEWHSLKSKPSTWIIIGHRLGKFVLNKYMYKKNTLKFTSVKEEINAISQEVQFSKITETACLSGWEFEADKSRYGVYVTPLLKLNRIAMFWMDARSEYAASMELAQSSLRDEQFLQFSKHYLSGFHRIFSFLTRENLVFFRYSY